MIHKYCKHWKLKCRNKPKIMAHKKGRKLKKTESWRMNGQNTEAVNGFKYLRVPLESAAVWNKHKPKQNNIQLS
jgi:hypothetical protein